MVLEIVKQIIMGFLIFIISYKMAMIIWLKWFSGTIYQYYEIGKEGEHIPVVCEYKGKEIKINVEYKHLKNPVYSYKGTTIYVFYINDKMVMSLSELQGDFIKKRWIDMNVNYDTGDVFKILRRYRKFKSEEWNKEWKEKRKERSIY